MELQLFKYRLDLRGRFSIANDSFDHQDTLIVALSHEGHTGYGEATVEPYYKVTYESMTEALRPLKERLQTYEFTTPEHLWLELQAELGLEPFAQCALDCAAYDLWGKLNEKTTLSLLGLDGQTGPQSNYTISIDSTAAMVANLKEFADWPVFKIKLGTERDKEIVTALRAVTDKVFRVDANTGWSVAKTMEMARFLETQNVEFIEQPLVPEDREGAERLFSQCPIPVVADESCVVESDVISCYGKFHGINIKLMKCGGITPALRMIEQARRQDMKVMVGCMAESSVGLSAIGQILPLLDYVDMDSVALLAADIASGVEVDRGVCRYNGLPGSGIRLVAEPLEKVSF